MNDYKLLSIAAEFVAKFEGYSSKIYICPAGYKTIGFGHVLNKIEEDSILFKNGITKENAIDILRKDLIKAKKSVESMVTVPITINQKIALISFIFNVGSGAFQRSSLRQALNRKEYFSASIKLLDWNKSNGKILKGLSERRRQEMLLFNKKDNYES